MPQYASYPLVGTAQPDDLILIHRDATGTEATIKYSSLTESGLAINVKDYGALGDGTTDDSAAIQGAFDAAIPGSFIVFPQSNTPYIVGSYISVGVNNITIVGYGATISGLSDTVFRKFMCVGRTGVVFDGLTIDGVYSSTTLGIGDGSIYLQNSNDCTVRNCWFKNIAQSGVFIQGSSARNKIENCKFTANFCAIFADDAGGSQTSKTIITGNHISDGLGSTATAYSGGIKISGTGSATTFSGHVISNNVIVNPGQMGIEIQTFVNDTAITGNTITGSGYGISVSACYRASVTGNTINNVTEYGIEFAASTYNSSASGNNVYKATLKAIIVVESNNVSISGGIITDSEAGVYTRSKATIISGVKIVNCLTAIGVHNSENIQISSCSITAGASSLYGIVLDSSDTPVNNVSIVGNYFSGTFQYKGISLYTPANNINDVLITGNNFAGATGGGGAIGPDGAVSWLTAWTNVRCYGNLGQVGDWQRAFEQGWYATSTSLAANQYTPHSFDSSTVAYDASGGAKTFELPAAANNRNWTTTITKTDSSKNAVTISGYGGVTINGASTYVLRAQGDSVTVVCSNGEWKVKSYVRRGVSFLYRSSNQAIPTGVETDVEWTGAYTDDNGAFSLTDPELLTVPTGARRVRITCGIRWEASAAGTYRFIKIKSNNSAVPYPLNSVWASDFRGPDTGIAPGSSCTLTTPIIPVENITNFLVTAAQDTGGNLNILGNHGGTYFQMEVIE